MGKNILYPNTKQTCFNSSYIFSKHLKVLYIEGHPQGKMLNQSKPFSIPFKASPSGIYFIWHPTPDFSISFLLHTSSSCNNGTHVGRRPPTFPYYVTCLVVARLRGPASKTPSLHLCTHFQISDHSAWLVITFPSAFTLPVLLLSFAFTLPFLIILYGYWTFLPLWQFWTPSSTAYTSCQRQWNPPLTISASIESLSPNLPQCSVDLIPSHHHSPKTRS